MDHKCTYTYSDNIRDKPEVVQTWVTIEDQRKVGIRIESIEMAAITMAVESSKTVPVGVAQAMQPRR